MKLINWLKEKLGLNNESLFYDDDEYRRVRKFKIILLIVSISVLILIILITFTALTMKYSLTNGESTYEPPIENPEF